MKIQKFDIQKGIYEFKLDEMKTEFHSHPAYEIVFSKSGGIDLETKNRRYKDVSLAIIAPNHAHKIEFKKPEVLVLMIECSTKHFENTVAGYGIVLSGGVYADNKTEERKENVKEIFSVICSSTESITADARVRKCLQYLNGSPADYKMIMKELKAETCFSDSRLSHLLKAEIGISIKKYFVWSKLKRAFEKVVRGEANMYEASIEYEFYDQAHLSKTFKKMLGINPSGVYNSRMLQV